MTKREAKQSIFESICPIVTQGGFRLRKREDAFVRRIPAGTQFLGVPFYDYNPEFEFSLTVSIRLDAVEDICNLFSGSPPEYQATTLTTITQLEYFGVEANPGFRASFLVRSKEDIAQAFASLSRVIRDSVIPFFDSHRDVFSLDRSLHAPDQPNPVRTDPWYKSFDSTDHPGRGMAAITIAFLANNIQFESLAESYLSQMRELPEDEKSRYSSLLAYLRSKRNSA